MQIPANSINKVITKRDIINEKQKQMKLRRDVLLRKNILSISNKITSMSSIPEKNPLCINDLSEIFFNSKLDRSITVIKHNLDKWKLYLLSDEETLHLKHIEDNGPYLGPFRVIRNVHFSEVLINYDRWRSMNTLNDSLKRARRSNTNYSKSTFETFLKSIDELRFRKDNIGKENRSSLITERVSSGDNEQPDITDESDGDWTYTEDKYDKIALRVVVNYEDGN